MVFFCILEREQTCFFGFSMCFVCFMIFQFKENIKRENQRKGKHVLLLFDFLMFFSFVGNDMYMQETKNACFWVLRIL